MIEPAGERCDREAGGGVGLTPAGQPLAGAIFTVGIIVVVGAGSVGLAPKSAPCGSLELSPQAESSNEINVTMRTFRLFKILTGFWD